MSDGWDECAEQVSVGSTVIKIEYDCPTCNGCGYIENDNPESVEDDNKTCPDCNGSGNTQEDEKVYIP